MVAVRRDELRSNFWRRKVAPAVLARDAWICHLCNKPIEYILDDKGKPRSRFKSPDPRSASVDHIRGAATGFDMRYLKAAHRGCNQKQGDPNRTKGDPKPAGRTRW